MELEKFLVEDEKMKAKYFLLMGVGLFLIGWGTKNAFLILASLTGMLMVGAVSASLKNKEELPDGKTSRWIPDKTKNFVMERQFKQCGAIGCIEQANLELHHKVPHASGGSNHPDNLVYLCPNHHTEITKGVRT